MVVRIRKFRVRLYKAVMAILESGEVRRKNARAGVRAQYPN